MEGDAHPTEIFERLEVFSDKIKKCIRYLLGPELKEMGLKSYHPLFLLPIERESGMSQKDLRECVPYDKSRVSMVVGELIAMGLVTDEGRGKTSVLRLTDSGREACRSFREMMESFNGEILSVLTEEELSMFLLCMHKLGSRVDGIIEQHSESGQIADKVRERYPQSAPGPFLPIFLPGVFGAIGEVVLEGRIQFRAQFL